MKAEARNKGSDWRENRDFSQSVREVIRTGRIEQARAMAADQVCIRVRVTSSIQAVAFVWDVGMSAVVSFQQACVAVYEVG